MPTTSLLLCPTLLRTQALGIVRPFGTGLRSFSTSRFICAPAPSAPGHLQHSYQPHPADPNPSSTQEGSPPTAVTTSTTPSPPALPPVWRSSRPHEQWTLAQPVYTRQDLEAVKVVFLEPKTPSDRIARWLVSFSRKGFDFVTGYKHSSPEAAQQALEKSGKKELTLEEKMKQGFVMDVNQWMNRILFLESIAGVPGMVCGLLRHLRSLRLMKRDGGWINTALQEAENERMHLMTFMKIKSPSKFFRFMVLGAQGVFYNLFFVAYMISPKAAHRFVAYLEEEACYTYQSCIDAVDRGEIPEWSDQESLDKKLVPQLAKDYWRLGDNATMRDLILAVRADEAGHRFVNHTFANLDRDDFNPVALKHAPPTVQGEKLGFTREESKAWARQVETEMREGFKAAAKVEQEQQQVVSKKE